MQLSDDPAGGIWAGAPAANALAVVGSPFTADVIAFAIRLVLEGALSLRAASRACSIFEQAQGGHGLNAPCAATVQNHLLRLGLYLIGRTDQRRSDWIWLLDHTINAGSTKCLMVVAISLEEFRRLDGPITHQDLTVIGVLPVESSTGEIVDGQLEQLSEQFGTPVATLSDRGSDLKKGLELFQIRHPEVACYYDIVHLVCRKIKSIFESDSRWEAYRKGCYQCANVLRQSSLAHLKPPTPKTKARYMNYDREVRWAIRAIRILDRVGRGELSERQRKRLSPELLRQRLGWLEEYRQSASHWMELILSGQAICRLIRRSGYSRQSASQVRQLAQRSPGAASLSLVNEVADEIEVMCDDLLEGVALPGSTEVLESLIGKGKRLLHHSGNSITRHILSLAAATTRVTAELVQEALSQCRLKQLVRWTQQNLKPGIQVARQEDLGASPEEMILRKSINVTIPNF